VDCSGPYGNQGCNGGLMDYAFEYVIKSGLVSESTYPYTATTNQCNTGLIAPVAATIQGFTNVAVNNPTALMTSVASQPVSVAVQANQYVWQYYKQGIITKNCGTELDHGVLIVGYNNTVTNGAIPYWIVKNSWGTDWGMAGYLYIEIKAKEGVCGINMSPSYPTE